jgi:hypothetical protein
MNKNISLFSSKSARDTAGPTYFTITPLVWIHGYASFDGDFTGQKESSE